MKNLLFPLFALLCTATLTARAQSGNLENGLAWKINEGALTIKKTGTCFNGKNHIFLLYFEKLITLLKNL